MAMAQSAQVAGLLTARTGCQVELVGLTTFGDVSRAELAQIGGTGVFVSGLRARLLGGEIDLAVHSLKDLPTGQQDGLLLAAVPPRDDPRDALAARNGAKLADLPAGARIGTGSPRRAAQLLMIRPDLRPVPIRGNAGTRLGKVDSGEVDAVVLGYAGLARIGRLDVVTQVFEPEEMMPAPGQACRPGRPAWPGRRRGQPRRHRGGAEPARRVAGRLHRADRRVCCRDGSAAARRGCRGARRGTGTAGERGGPGATGREHWPPGRR